MHQVFKFSNEHRKGVAPANKQISCIVECLSCGKTKFKTKRALERAPLTFCDAKCQIRWQRTNTDFQRGELNSAFIHGKRVNGAIADYGSDFTSALRRQIKMRDNFDCQKCHVNFSGTSGKFLDVHHIDLNKFNNDPNNLISLCKRCHTLTHWEEV